MKRVQRELRIIRDDLHCTAVRVIGGDPERIELPAWSLQRTWGGSDSEITFLLMLACMRAVVGDDEIRVAGRIRIRHSGLGRDAYQSQHLLARFT